jgi:hypothetical protein
MFAVLMFLDMGIFAVIAYFYKYVSSTNNGLKDIKLEDKGEEK